MNISRVKILRGLISFVLVFIMFSYLSPIQASEKRDLYYYYDSTVEQTQKNTKSSSYKKFTSSTKSTTNDDDDYEVYVVKVNQNKARTAKGSRLTFSQMAKAINKKQKIRNHHNAFSQFNSNTKIYF